MDSSLEQTMALAGVAQCAFMVRQLALHGVASGDKYAVAVNSLLNTNPRTTEEVYGSVKNLNLGLQAIQEILEGNSAVFSADEILHYIMKMLHLQSKLMKNPKMLDVISRGLDRINALPKDGPIAEDREIIMQLARLYQETLSTLPFRIQVKGDMTRLQNEFLAAKIRVLLFAGVRSAVLWEQRGGRRWHLLFKRKRISRNVNRLLHNLG